jgi:MoxR-like ATPase
MSPSEIMGMYVPAKESFEWMDGPLALAYKAKAGLLILDEIIEASGPCKTLLYGALDDGPGGKISYVGRDFTPSNGYHVGATMNGWPYEGGLPEALLDRFDAVFAILKPSPKQLDTLDKDLRLICAESYESAKDPMLGPDVTFRMLRSLQKLRRVLPVEQATLAACRGNSTVAAALLEVLALAGEEDDEEEEQPKPAAPATTSEWAGQKRSRARKGR